MSRRQAWRKWPRRICTSVFNDTTTRIVHFKLECGHSVEMPYGTVGWPPGTSVPTGCPHVFYCGHCHYGSPEEKSQPFTGRCEYFEGLMGFRDPEDPRQLWLPGVSP